MKSHTLSPRLNAPGLRSLESVRYTPDVSALWQSLISLFHIPGFWHRVAAFLTGPTEPQIYSRRDRRGKVYYRLYDPRTDQRRVFSSEEDIRIWLDQRY